MLLNSGNLDELADSEFADYYKSDDFQTLTISYSRLEAEKMKEDSDLNHPDVVTYPMMPARDVVVFPSTKFAIRTRTSIAMRAVEEALASNQKIFIVAQRDVNIDEPTLEQIYSVGTICTILQSKKSDGRIEVVLDGQERAVAVRLENTDGFLTVYVRPASAFTNEDEAVVNTLKQQVNQLVEQLHKLQQHAVGLDLSLTSNIKDPLQLADIIARQLLIQFEHKQRMLEMLSKRDRLEWLFGLLNTELEERTLDKLLRARVARYTSTFYPKWRAILALFYIKEGHAKQLKTLSDLAGHKLKSFEDFLPFVNSPETQREIEKALSDPKLRQTIDEQIALSVQGRLSYVHKHLVRKIDLAIVSLFHEAGIGFQQDLREISGQPPAPSKQLANLASNEIRAVKYRLGVKRGRHPDNPEEALKKLINEKKDFIKKVKAAKKKLLKKGQRVTKTAVAQELGMGGINERGTDSRRQVLDGKLKKYGLEFSKI